MEDFGDYEGYGSHKQMYVNKKNKKNKKKKRTAHLVEHPCKLGQH